MKECTRQHPSFALCGLNCCLCPRYHTDGTSRCPGCGGPHFSQSHPPCAVFTCNSKHDSVEFCFQCTQFPCNKYSTQSQSDSFISYRNVLSNMEDAARDLKKYLAELTTRHEILIDLLTIFNDGRSKGFYCQAANLLPLAELLKIMKQIDGGIRYSEGSAKEKSAAIKELLKSKADEMNIGLALRK